ncbi:MAG: permease prefix domain 1-containing protein, partial [Armatimonadota bacterium]|nr:permease prefix domain 1-containing protein [Armatimonadota bacterium]
MNSRPERPPLDRYLDQICRRLLFVSARERRETREELRQHLNTLAAHAARQVEPAKAMEEAMKKFGDPKEIGHELSKQHLRRRRWLSALLKTAMGTALTVLIVVFGYSAYWYFALSQPLEREPAPTPVASVAATLAAIQAAQDGYAHQIHSVRFQSTQTVHT